MYMYIPLERMRSGGSHVEDAIFEKITTLFYISWLLFHATGLTSCTCDSTDLVFFRSQHQNADTFRNSQPSSQNRSRSGNSGRGTVSFTLASRTVPD